MEERIMEFPIEGLSIGQFDHLISYNMMKFVDDLGNFFNPQNIPMYWLCPMQLVWLLQTYLTAIDHLKKSFELCGYIKDQTKFHVQPTN